MLQGRPPLRNKLLSPSSTPNVADALIKRQFRSRKLGGKEREHRTLQKEPRRIERRRRRRRRTDATPPSLTLYLDLAGAAGVRKNAVLDNLVAAAEAEGGDDNLMPRRRPTRAASHIPPRPRTFLSLKQYSCRRRRRPTLGQSSTTKAGLMVSFFLSLSPPSPSLSNSSPFPLQMDLISGSAPNAQQSEMRTQTLAQKGRVREGTRADMGTL